MNTVKIQQYAASKGARALSKALNEAGINSRRLKRVGSTYRHKEYHLILNWGCHTYRNLNSSFPILNRPELVAIAANKLATFEMLTEGGYQHIIPEYTTSRVMAEEMINLGYTVYCRTLLNSSKGRGIVIANTAAELVDAPLYVKKIQSQREVRIHVFNGNVISFVEKKKMSSERLAEDGITFNPDIRNHENGWVFAREDVSIPDNCLEAAVTVVEALGLDFGAVDMSIYLNQPTVLEVNTAPGLGGVTIGHYCQAVVELLDAQ